MIGIMPESALSMLQLATLSGSILAAALAPAVAEGMVFSVGNGKVFAFVKVDAGAAA